MSISKSSNIGSNGNLIFPPYDVIVDADGYGHYTSLYDAFTAEGASKSYFIANGTYTETNSFAFPSNARVTFDKVTLNMNGCTITNAPSASGFYAEGHLILGGTGTEAYTQLLYFDNSCSSFDMSNLWIDVDLSNLQTPTNYILPVQISGSKHKVKLNFLPANITINKAVYLLYCDANTVDCEFWVKANTIDQSQNQSVYSCYVTGSDRNVFHLQIYNITSAGTSYGLYLLNDSYNQADGSIVTVDDTYYTSGSTGQNVAALLGGV